MICIFSTTLTFSPTCFPLPRVFSQLQPLWNSYVLTMLRIPADFLIRALALAPSAAVATLQVHVWMILLPTPCFCFMTSSRWCNPSHSLKFQTASMQTWSSYPPLFLNNLLILFNVRYHILIYYVYFYYLFSSTVIKF